LIPYKYDFANEMYKEVAIIKINGKYGLIVIIRIIKFHHRGCFILTKNWYNNIYKDGLVGLMDKNGKILVPSKYETIGKENSEKYGFTLS
jgi:hypothetical protein